MKLDRKGFMMAEVVIVAAMILLILMTIYSSYNKVFRRYSEILDYYNVDGIYELASIRDKLILEDKIHNILSNNLSDGYYNYNAGGNRKVYFFKKSYLSNENSVNNFNESTTFKDYVKYLNSSVTFNSDYIMVIEMPYTTDKYYYNYLELEV